MSKCPIQKFRLLRINCFFMYRFLILNNLHIILCKWYEDDFYILTCTCSNIVKKIVKLETNFYFCDDLIWRQSLNFIMHDGSWFMDLLRWNKTVFIIWLIMILKKHPFVWFWNARVVPTQWAQTCINIILFKYAYICSYKL